MLEMEFAKTEIVVRNGVGAVSPTLIVQEEHVVVDKEEMGFVMIPHFVALKMVFVDQPANNVDVRLMDPHPHLRRNHLRPRHQ